MRNKHHVDKTVQDTSTGRIRVCVFGECFPVPEQEGVINSLAPKETENIDH